VVGKGISALAGDAPSVTSLPSRKHIATAVGTLLAILPSILCGKIAAEFEPESDGRFVTGFVLMSVAGNMVVRTIDSVPFPSD